MGEWRGLSLAVDQKKWIGFYCPIQKELFPNGITLVEDQRGLPPEVAESSQAVTLQGIASFMAGLVWVAVNLCHPKIWQPLTNADGMGKIHPVSRIGSFVAVAHPIKQIGKLMGDDEGIPPSRKMGGIGYWQLGDDVPIASKR